MRVVWNRIQNLTPKKVKLKNDASATTAATGWLHFQCHFGSFIERLANSAILHSRAFCLLSVQTTHKVQRRDKPKYLTAPTSFAFASPSSKVTASGFSFCSSSLRKSHLSAVRTIFTPGQFSWISAIHLVDTFSKESRLSTYSIR